MLQARDEQPTAGLMAGDGAAMMHLLVFTGPVPQTPPRELADLVEPVEDARGEIRDWRFRASSLQLGQEPRPEYIRYRRWRATYLNERILGERATVLQFLDWAARHTDVSALQVLRLPQAHWELNPAIRAEEQARRAAAACRASREEALGIVAQPDARHPQARIMRGFVVDSSPLLILATASASVTATADALLVADGGSQHAVHGWRTDDAGLVATTDEGAAPLGESPGGRLLDRLAPGCSDVVVSRVRLSSIFALLCTNLAELAHTATTARTTLWARVGAS